MSLVLIVLFIVFQGGLILLQKLAAAHFNWQTCLLLIWTTAFVGNMAFAAPAIRLSWSPWVLVGIGAGILAIGSTVTMYRIIETVPVSVYGPIVGLSFVLPTILSYLLLHESFSWRKAAGAACAVAAVLLMKGAK